MKTSRTSHSWAERADRVLDLVQDAVVLAVIMVLAWVALAPVAHSATRLVLNAAVTQANVHATVCTPDWTKGVRPPVSYTQALKAKQLGPGQPLAGYEEDHYTPLCLGGAPRDPRNLWPQPWPQARRKDTEERALCRAVCEGRISLQAAQVKLAADWPR
jgi:hypothetical protein